MPEKEEIALLRSSTELAAAESDATTLPEDTTLGRQMYLARRRKQMTLVQAENELSIGMAYLQAMEDEKFSLLPQGPLAIQMLRSYAAYLGLDVSRVLQEYEKSHAIRFTAPSFGQRRSLTWPSIGHPPRWAVWVTAVFLALFVSGAGIFFLDPDGVEALGSKLYHLVDRAGGPAASSPTPTPTSTITMPMTLSPTRAPSPTITPSPRSTLSPTSRPSPTPTTRPVSPTADPAADPAGPTPPADSEGGPPGESLPEAPTGEGPVPGEPQPSATPAVAAPPAE